jgi:hypothetical protein
MPRSKLRPYVGNVAVEVGTSSIADRFVQVMAHISLEYDLPPDVWAAAEDVLRALKARGKKWPRQTGEVIVLPPPARASHLLWLLIRSKL